MVLQITIPLGIISIGLFNITGLSVTKYINALARSVLNMTKTVLIWGVGIALTLTLGKTNDAFKWENVEPRAVGLQAFGFILLILATLVYN